MTQIFLRILSPKMSLEFMDIKLEESNSHQYRRVHVLSASKSITSTLKSENSFDLWFFLVIIAFFFFSQFPGAKLLISFIIGKF